MLNIFLDGNLVGWGVGGGGGGGGGSTLTHVAIVLFTF